MLTVAGGGRGHFFPNMWYRDRTQEKRASEVFLHRENKASCLLKTGC